MNKSYFSEFILGLSTNVKGRILIFSCGVFASAWFVSMIIKYSLISYAIHYGFRVPVEGTPIDELFTGYMVFIFTITLSTFSYLSLPSVNFSRRLRDVTDLLISYINMFNRTIDYIGKQINEDESDVDEYRSSRKRTVIPLLLLTFILVTVISIFIIYLMPFVYERMGFSEERIETFKLIFSVIFIPYIGVTFFLWLLTLLQPFQRPLYAGILAVLYSIIMFIFPLYHELPTSLLRLTSYGGGISITMDLDVSSKESDKGCRVRYSSNLMLLTNKVAILYESAEDEFLEIPTERICEIRLSPEKEIKMPISSPNYKNLIFGI